MKKLRRWTSKNGLFLTGLLLTSLICLPRLMFPGSAASAEELNILNSLKGYANLSYLRPAIFGLILLNLSLVYGIFSAWFGKRKAGLSTILLASIPVWLLMQITIPRFTLVLTPLLVALWAFDKAGRSKKAPRWYLLSGIAITITWLQEPVGTTFILLLCILLLIGLKPRYAKHIARQSSLVLIVLVASVGALSAASWKLQLGVQDYLLQRLSSGITVTLNPQFYVNGPSNHYFALPGVSIVPLAVAALAGLGAWQLFVQRKRPRNLFVLLLPLLLGVTALQFSGVTALMLLSLALIGVSTWATTGVEFLRTSWHRLFPDNKLAATTANVLVALMVASLALYSSWYINMAWSGSPQSQSTTTTKWSGTL